MLNKLMLLKSNEWYGKQQEFNPVDKYLKLLHWKFLWFITFQFIFHQTIYNALNLIPSFIACDCLYSLVNHKHLFSVKT